MRCSAYLFACYTNPYSDSAAPGGTTFSVVLTQLCRDLARPLLSDGRLAVAEVAFLLGYEDPSAFQRAFRRWSGHAPGAFRRAAAIV